MSREISKYAILEQKRDISKKKVYVVNDSGSSPTYGFIGGIFTTESQIQDFALDAKFEILSSR